MACFAGASGCARPELPKQDGDSSAGDAAVPRDAETDQASSKPDTGIVVDNSIKPGVPDAAAPVVDAGKTPEVDAGGPTLPNPTVPKPVIEDAGTPAADLCRLRGREVAILGDSFIRLTGDFTRLLQNKARAAGALSMNETYVDVSQPLASMVRAPNIPSQYPAAVDEGRRRGGGAPKLVIMTGGGQDVLIDNRPCLNPSSADEVANTPECVAVVDEVLDTAQQLIDTGIAAGTRAAIYFFYPNLPRNSLAGGANGNSVIDYAAPRAKELCEGQTAAPCYFVDLRPSFADPNNPGYPRPGLIGLDGVTPTPAGAQLVADAVWDVMQANCLASQ